jgi:hypothetical protein
MFTFNGPGITRACGCSHNPYNGELGWHRADVRSQSQDQIQDNDEGNSLLFMSLALRNEKGCTI